MKFLDKYKKLKARNTFVSVLSYFMTNLVSYFGGLFAILWVGTQLAYRIPGLALPKGTVKIVIENNISYTLSSYSEILFYVAIIGAVISLLDYRKK